MAVNEKPIFDAFGNEIHRAQDAANNKEVLTEQPTPVEGEEKPKVAKKAEKKADKK
jgi:hypothetical protein